MGCDTTKKKNLTDLHVMLPIPHCNKSVKMVTI